MEEDQQNLKLEDSNQLALKDLLIKNDEEVKEEASSSNENKKETEASKDSPESLQKEEEKCRSRTPTPPARSSPEPSCAICLEQLQNKSFTDSCFHMFCFTCLVEWSKVKPECPLCKQSFKSIVHNVRSFKDYDQYYIKSRMSENLWRCVADRSFRYSTTLTSERILERNQTDYSDRIESAIASHRMQYAPHLVHSVRMYASSQSVRHIPCAFRRRIYEENLWVRPIVSGRIRFISPEFFRRNIACTHRLLPWLNRELLVVMPNNESQIPFVVELIMALIVKYDITSQEFYAHIEPYTLTHTAHFIHEFHYFAVSPYESMDTYDLYAQYSSMSFPVIQDVSSPDSDVIPINMNESHRSSGTEPKRKKQHHSKKKHSKEYKKLKKIVLKRNSENNCWESVPSVPFMGYNLPNPYEVPGPSTSRENSYQDFSTETELDEPNEVECLGGKDDDECQVLEVLKPRRERTPEIVDLSSENEEEKSNLSIHDISDDPDVLFSAEISGKDNPSRFVSSRYNFFEDVSNNDDDIVFVSESKSNSVVADTPIDYSIKPAEKETATDSISQEAEPCTSNTKNDECDTSQTKTTNSDCPNDDTRSSSWSPLLRSKKRRAVILDDSSTESCSEATPVSELKSGIKKLKLKSVVAHFSYDNSDEHNDSTHHSSSHKKHKERKKKKKKHKHKARHIYVSDSN